MSTDQPPSADASVRPAWTCARTHAGTYQLWRGRTLGAEVSPPETLAPWFAHLADVALIEQIEMSLPTGDGPAARNERAAHLTRFLVRLAVNRRDAYDSGLQDGLARGWQMMVEAAGEPFRALRAACIARLGLTALSIAECPWLAGVHERGDAADPIPVFIYPQPVSRHLAAHLYSAALRNALIPEDEMPAPGSVWLVAPACEALPRGFVLREALWASLAGAAGQG